MLVSSAVRLRSGSPGARNPYNFSGGPGALPESVLRETQEAILEAPGAGLSVLGIGHRTAWFRNVVDETRANLRSLLGLSSEYETLLLQGGASLQFSMIPMALLRGRSRSADYIVSGYWSAKAVPEAQREGSVRVIWNGEKIGFSRLPRDDELIYDSKAAYLHYASNETVEGLQFQRVPGDEHVRRICDMSSDFLCRPVEMDQFALAYAHAQKNLGPAGVTIVTLKKDLLDEMPGDLPSMLDYRRHIEMGSIYNTPPVFSIYVTLLVTRWLLNFPGGLAGVAARNRAKAAELYGAIDGSEGFYRGRASTEDRSLMNVAFNLPNEGLEKAFLEEAEALGFSGLEGHRSCGGIRASLYNAVTLEATCELRDFMKDFRTRNLQRME